MVLLVFSSYEEERWGSEDINDLPIANKNLVLLGVSPLSTEVGADYCLCVKGMNERVSRDQNRDLTSPTHIQGLSQGWKTPSSMVPYDSLLTNRQSGDTAILDTWWYSDTDIEE